MRIIEQMEGKRSWIRVRAPLSKEAAQNREDFERGLYLCGEAAKRWIAEAAARVPVETAREIADLHSLDLRTESGIRATAREWLAQQAENGVPKTRFFRRMISSAKVSLRKAGFNDIRYSDADLQGVVRDALRAGRVHRLSRPQPEQINPSVLEEFSPKLFHQAVVGANEIRKFAEEQNEEETRSLSFEQWFIVFSEFHYFYLHIVDRAACSLLPPFRRTAVMNALEPHCINLAVETVCRGMPPDKIQALQKESLADLREAHEEFGQYKRVFPKPKESPAGFLIWEAGKVISSAAGHPLNIDFIVRAEPAHD